jgi:hypothetical protein
MQRCPFQSARLDALSNHSWLGCAGPTQAVDRVGAGVGVPGGRVCRRVPCGQVGMCAVGLGDVVYRPVSDWALLLLVLPHPWARFPLPMDDSNLCE